MPGIDVFDQLVSSATSTPAQSMPAASPGFRLRRTGGRPLEFHGSQLGHANSYRPGTAQWYELNLYSTNDGRYVADIHVYKKAEGAPDAFHVDICSSVDEAVAVFENFDPVADLDAGFAIDGGLAPAELMVEAAALRYRIHDAQRQYRAVLASFLHELNG